MHLAHSRVEVKTISEERRTFTGIASTPTLDRVGDKVEPGGAVYHTPIPLLWQHRSDQPIGEIDDVQVSKNSIVVRGKVFKAAQSRTLIDRLDEAWESLKLGLVKGLSIGFTPIEFEPIDKKDPWGGMHFLKWDWHELSAVTIPANVEASIQTIKSMDRRFLVASGRKENVVWLDESWRVRRNNVVYLTQEDRKP